MASTEPAPNREPSEPSVSSTGSPVSARRSGAPLVAAIALGHLGFGLGWGNPDVVELLALECLLCAGVALVGALEPDRGAEPGDGVAGPGARARRGAVFGVAYAAAVGLAWLLLASVATTWIAAGSLLVLLGLVSYGLHRYQLVALGLVGRADA